MPGWPRPAGWTRTTRRGRVKAGGPRHRGRRGARLAHPAGPLPGHRRPHRSRGGPAAGRDALAGATGISTSSPRTATTCCWPGTPTAASSACPLYGALVTNCGIDPERVSGLHRHPAGCPAEPAPAWLHVSGWARHLAMGTGPVRLPAGGHPAHAGAPDRLDCRRFQGIGSPGASAPKQSAGCGAAWQRASFGTKRPPVQIRPPRPVVPGRRLGFCPA